jgi:hypothetical protein
VTVAAPAIQPHIAVHRRDHKLVSLDIRELHDLMPGVREELPVGFISGERVAQPNASSEQSP